MNCILCRILYAIGDWWSKCLMPLVPDSWERLGPLLATPYSHLMNWSVLMDVRGNCGLWEYARDLRDEDQVTARHMVDKS